MNLSGLIVTLLPSSSPLYRAGLRKGDRVLAVSGEPVGDELDFRFYAASPEFQIDFDRRGKQHTILVERDSGAGLEVEFRPERIRRCANRCIFCFIDQMPPGLRSRLYIKDEDLTLSFINGNYVTLANATSADLEKILRLGLSPLFISVHATDPTIRAVMLGNRRARPIMEQLSLLAGEGVALHTQIVVCPGYNDGTVLARTIRDLLSLGPNLLSVAVVPVGLTRFRRVPLVPVDRSIAASVCAMVSRLSDRDQKRSGIRRAFLADEFFLKAGLAIPEAHYYEEYPQIENGVGLIRQLLDGWKKAKRRSLGTRTLQKPKRYLLATALSALPFLERIAADVSKRRPGISITVEAVKNRFFGESVSVAGLLTAKDVLQAIREEKRSQKIANS